MINELTKSFIRSLGRILAYILIGFLLFFIFDKVKAESLEASRYQVQSIRTNWGIGYNGYVNNDGIAVDGNINTIPPTAYSTMGWQWLPVNSSNAYLPLKKGEYSISIIFEFGFLTNNTFPYNPPYLYISVGGDYVNATCDGSSSFERIETEIGGGSNYVAENRYQYNCSKLIVNQDFDRVRFRAYWNGLPNNITIVAFRPIEFSFIDLSNISNDTNIIINNDNINTQNIINNQDSNTDRIVQSQNDINSSINNSSIDNPNSSFNGFNNNVASTQGIESIFLLPITLFQTIINNNSGTCSPISFGSLYGTNLTLPCINIQSYLGSSIYTIIDLFCSLALIMGLRKYVLEIFNKITSLKEDNLQ